MSVNLKTRGLVFATFFGSCLIIGLLVAALTTEYWVEAHAKNAKNDKAEGRIRLGLFGGSKELNKAYGWRYNRTDTNSFIQEDVIQYIWWLLTTIGVGVGLLSSFIAGVASVIRAASAAKKRGTMVILIVSNISTLGGQLVALVAWTIQFYKSLHQNVLLLEDREAHWNSEGMAWLGRSFLFVIGGMVVSVVNLILLIAALKHEDRYRRRYHSDNGDDKMNGAIMLY